MDNLFPERTRHKNITQNVRLPVDQSETVATNAENSNEVEFRGVETTNDEEIIDDDDDDTAAPIRAPIHSKTQNWYSGYCNRWASLLGALTKILIMLLVNWVYAIASIAFVVILWFYVGTANPAVKPGLAQEFRFFDWIKSTIFRCFGYSDSFKS